MPGNVPVSVTARIRLARDRVGVTGTPVSDTRGIGVARDRTTPTPVPVSVTRGSDLPYARTSAVKDPVSVTLATGEDRFRVGAVTEPASVTRGRLVLFPDDSTGSVSAVSAVEPAVRFSPFTTPVSAAAAKGQCSNSPVVRTAVVLRLSAAISASES